jgi:four helix bundle protein
VTENELKQRTGSSALRIFKVIDSPPDSRSGRVVAGQLGRSGTSTGANDRAACRFRLVAEMISKLAVVEEEADEPGFWMELAADHGLLPAMQLSPRQKEAGDLTAIMVPSRKTLIARNRESRIENPK